MVIDHLNNVHFASSWNSLAQFVVVYEDQLSFVWLQDIGLTEKAEQPILSSVTMKAWALELAMRRFKCLRGSSGLMVALSDSISLEMRDAVRIVQAVVAESNGLIIRETPFSFAASMTSGSTPKLPVMTSRRTPI